MSDKNIKIAGKDTSKILTLMETVEVPQQPNKEKRKQKRKQRNKKKNTQKENTTTTIPTLADEILKKNNTNHYDLKTVSGLTNSLIRKTRAGKSLGERYSFFPIHDPEMYKAFKKQEAALWSSNEMDFSRDKKDYEELKPEHKRIIDYVNAFFSATDGLIIDNIALRFLLEASTVEEQAFYIAQLFDELVHSETYSLIINTLIPSVEERNDLFMAANNLKCVRDKNLWLEKYMTSDIPTPYRRLAFAAGEGIFFTSSFLFVFYFRSKGVLQNIIFANEQISKDEGMHRDTGIILYKRDGLLDNKDAARLIDEAVNLECAFVDELLPETVDDLDPIDVKKFVRFLGDHLLYVCGHPRKYGIKASELPTWMNDIAMEQKGNFYEVRIGNYKQSSLSKALDWQGRISGSSENIEKAYTDPTSVEF